jgi:hypothetical protein
MNVIRNLIQRMLNNKLNFFTESSHEYGNEDIP